jgi:hypothetical protein
MIIPTKTSFASGTITCDEGLFELTVSNTDSFIHDLKHCKKHRSLMKSIKHCKKDMGTSMCKECSEDFIIHGDLWANNLLFDKSEMTARWSIGS